MKLPAEILLVDDNEGDIELTKIAFEEGKLSCHLSVVHNGALALDFLAKRGEFGGVTTPDLILLDINMPLMDGMEFLKIIKADERWKAIPVIVLTSSDADGDVRAFYAQHANCYIIKPMGLDKFIDVAKRIESFWLELARLASRPVA